MALNVDEAKMLAENIARVEQYYPSISGIITGRIAAHGALLASLAGIYGPRFAAIKIRKASEKAATVNPETGQPDIVMPFRRNPQQQ